MRMNPVPTSAKIQQVAFRAERVAAVSISSA
jgi:hypothetical protein